MKRRQGQHIHNPWRQGPALKTRRAQESWARIEKARNEEKKRGKQ
jgi:hypothetical protein